MKKLLNILLLLSLLLVLNVKADMGPPAFPTLKGEVRNDNTKCYKDEDLKEVERVLEKGKVIEIYNYGSKNYAYQYDPNNEEGYCYVILKDLNFNDQKYELSDEDKIGKEIDLMVVETKGIEMYKGPSYYYDKSNITIPAGTKLKTQYRMGSFWYYVTYNGVSGYISSEHKTIVNNEDEIQDNKLFTIDNSDILVFSIKSVEAEEESKVVGTIPANTLVDVYWSTDYDRYYYVEYNGTKGFVFSFGTFAYDCSGGKIETLGDLNLYDNLGSKRKKIGTVPKGKEYSVTYLYNYYDEEGYYIPELKGWVFNYLSEDNRIDDKKYVKYTDSKGENPLENKVVFESVEIKGHNINFSREQSTYTVELEQDETKLEFVIVPDDVEVEILNNEDLKNNSVVTLRVKDDDGTYAYIFKIVKAEKPGDVTPPQPEPDPKKDGLTLTNEELIMICVGAGVIIAVTILVTIKLVNKKKNREETPVQDDTNKES